MKIVFRILALFCTALLLAAACGQSDAPEPTAESVGEAEEEVVGASCSIDSQCTGFPPQHCCASLCRASCDDAYCGNCSTNCTATGQHCLCSNGHGVGSCVECNSQNDCSGGKVCTSHSCVCTSGKTDCSGTCKDLQTDEANCGSCGNACGAGQACVAGSCFNCPGGTCTSCTTDHNCPFKTKCESGVCTGHCIDHTGCSDDQLCINSVCTSATAVGADQTAKNTYCRNTYDGGGVDGGDPWRMESCNIGGTDYCVQTVANLTHNWPSAYCANGLGLCTLSSIDVSVFGLQNGTTSSTGSCSSWDASSCIDSVTHLPKASCVWKMCPAPAEGSTCNDYW